jgi:hypothetical protein
MTMQHDAAISIQNEGLAKSRSPISAAAAQAKTLPEHR